MNRRALTLAAVALGAGATGVLWRSRQDLAPAPAAGGPTGHSSTPAAGASNVSEGSLWSQSVERLDGTTWSLDALRGQPIIVNFWATWCPPCIREMPLLDRFIQGQRPPAGQARWRLLGLAIDRRDAVARFLEQNPVSYDIALASVDAIAWSRSLGNASGGLPFTVAFDLQGRPLYQKVGEISEPELMRWVVPRS